MSKLNVRVIRLAPAGKQASIPLLHQPLWQRLLSWLQPAAAAHAPRLLSSVSTGGDGASACELWLASDPATDDTATAGTSSRTIWL